VYDYVVVMKRIRVGLLSVSLLSSCAGDRGDEGRLDAAAGGTVDVAGADLSSMFAPEQCRWLGYGIGGPTQMQCGRQHLLAHSAAACGHSGGIMEGTTRDVAGSSPGH
jgi:hypothetical protein